MKGLVVKSTGSWYKVLTDYRQCREAVCVGNEHPADAKEYDCRLRGNFRIHDNKQTNPIAVGDRVEFSLEPDDTGFITEVEERKNCIIRKATKLSKQTHVIAANIDCLCVVATLAFPRTSTGFIDRLLVTAEAYHIPAAVIFNKIDLYDAHLTREQVRLQGIYQDAGYPVYQVSALQHQGLASVLARIQGNTVLFAGHSGVGKTALLNALDPTLSLREGAVSDWSLKGRHTTTYAQLYPFAGGFLIDTPGIKEFGMVDIRDEELSHFFPEMRARLHDCHFANCTHRHEPHCAVKEAVEQGLISAERYNNYLNILSSLEEDKHNSR